MRVRLAAQGDGVALAVDGGDRTDIGRCAALGQRRQQLEGGRGRLAARRERVRGAFGILVGLPSSSAQGAGDVVPARRAQLGVAHAEDHVPAVAGGGHHPVPAGGGRHRGGGVDRVLDGVGAQGDDHVGGHPDGVEVAEIEGRRHGLAAGRLTKCP